MKIGHGLVLFSILIALSLGVAFADKEAAENTTVEENMSLNNSTINETMNLTNETMVNETLENVTLENATEEEE
jgi:hypothetical protein